jgi:hypothetical protein
MEQEGSEIAGYRPGRIIDPFPLEGAHAGGTAGRRAALPNLLEPRHSRIRFLQARLGDVASDLIR